MSEQLYELPLPVQTYFVAKVPDPKGIVAHV